MAGVVCQHCGTTNPAGARFCSACDEFLDWSGAPEAADAGAPQGAGPPDATPPTGAPPSSAAPASPQHTQPIPPPSVTRPLPPVRPASPPGPPATAAPPGPAFEGLRPPTGAPVRTPVAAPPGGGYGSAFEPTPGQPLPVATTRQCHQCGIDNPLQRRFCRRCGAWLVSPSPPVAVSSLPLRRRLRDRWWGAPRTAYQGRLARSTIVFRTLSIVATLLVVGLLLGVAGFNPVTRARDYVGHVLGSGRVVDVQAAADPPDAVDDHPAAWATDDVRGRGWTTRWTAPGAGDPEVACAATPVPAVASALVLTFGAPVNVREIGIEAGLAADDQLIDTRWRPRTLELRWDGGGCQRVDLEKTPDLQRFRVDQGRDVRGVRITVVAGYQPTTAGQPGADRLDIGEVTFWQR